MPGPFRRDTTGGCGMRDWAHAAEQQISGNPVHSLLWKRPRNWLRGKCGLHVDDAFRGFVRAIPGGGRAPGRAHSCPYQQPQERAKCQQAKSSHDINSQRGLNGVLTIPAKARSNGLNCRLARTQCTPPGRHFVKQKPFIEAALAPQAVAAAQSHAGAAHGKPRAFGYPETICRLGPCLRPLSAGGEPIRREVAPRPGIES